jgi:hypothetical protein
LLAVANEANEELLEVANEVNEELLEVANEANAVEPAEPACCT